MTTPSLIAFILARFAEDEAHVRDDDFTHAPHVADCGYAQVEMLRPCKCQWPARLLAESAAKRRIVELAQKANALDPRGDGVRAGMIVAYGEVLLDLAAPYSSHPDFRNEWHA